MKLDDPIDIVRHFSGLISNGRTLDDIFRHANLEMDELREELDKEKLGETPGDDGVIGEAIDVIACALDIIFVKRPQTSNEEITDLLLAKCQKWARRYQLHIDGDRSID